MNSSAAPSANESNSKHGFGIQLGAVQRELILISILSLFCELMIIRWLSTEIRIFAYFKNLPLMAAFLGLGLGFIWTQHKTDFIRWSAIAFLFVSLLLVSALAMHWTFLSFVDPFKFMLFGVGVAADTATASGTLLTTLWSLLIMIGTFALTTLVFVGFGQRTGQLFEKLKPLEAYSLNVFGALVGTVLFSVLCWLGTSPGIWLVVAGIGFLLLRRTPVHFAIVAMGLVYYFWLASFIAHSFYGDQFVETVWSPYYRIDLTRVPAPTFNSKNNLSWGYSLYVNYDNFQQILDCSPENLARFPADVQAKMRESFEPPFHLFGKPADEALVLGAGNGTDIAAALRVGVKHIDAVEIDPGIVALGKRKHPERPYESPNVSLHVMDARTFLKKTDNKYDVILFAFVDSHAAFSAMSSLRTDNYLFTQESMNDAARHLKPDGVIVVRFLTMADWLWQRHGKTLANATGMTPLGYRTEPGRVESGMFIAGPGIVGRSAPVIANMPPRQVNLDNTTPVCTDDWPFLFLPAHGIPTVYMLPIFAVLLFGFTFVAGQFRTGVKDALNWQMFLTGMGFMMLEVRAMSTLSLLFGSTWIVNSTVISGVMIVILLANLAVTKMNSRPLLMTGGLMLAALIGSNLTSVAGLVHLGEVPAQTLGTAIFLSPMVFAAVIFSLIFKESRSVSNALAFNVVGGLVGICLEYISMWLGMRALGWLAIIIYASVLIIDRLRTKNQKSPEKLQEDPSAP
ncbi:MAG: methyltransferase domain-containing protein [Candidatus Obscuribacterales bacterium]|nr:methyltransferase domain-containing protein [Candidatus Obscuribacterales bacterium]